MKNAIKERGIGFMEGGEFAGPMDSAIQQRVTFTGKLLHGFLCVFFGLYGFLFSQRASAAATYDQALGAARIISRWVTNSASHQDFLSATPTGVRRAGTKFFVKEPPLQMASDYGISAYQTSAGDSVARAYETLGLSLSSSSRTLTLNRFHLTWSFANRHDFSYSQLFSSSLKGWGLGYKLILYHDGPLYVSTRFGYSQSERAGFFNGEAMISEIGASLYFKVVDCYLGLRHSFGWSEFDASVPELQLPRVSYIASLQEIEWLAGILVATTTETRLALQLSQRESEFAFVAKISFRFEALYPTLNNWFRDPRALKQ